MFRESLIIKKIKSVKRKAVKLYKSLIWFYHHRNERENIVFTKNRNAKERAARANCYDYLSEKYKYIITKGVETKEPSKKSNKIWICWLQGMDKAPDLVKACHNSVIQNFSDKEIVILEEANLQDYVQFPNYIIEKWKKGIIPNAQFSDLIRIDLLCRYGGIWCDATVLCTETPPPVMTENKLFVFKSIDLLRRDKEPTICSNWYIEAWSNQRILLLTRKLLFEYWKNEESLKDYFIFHLFFAMAARRYPEDWEAIPVFNNNSPHTLQFEFSKPYSAERWEQICRMSPIHKLNHHVNYANDNENFYSYILKQYGENNYKNN